MTILYLKVTLFYVVWLQEQNTFIDKLKAAIRAKGPPLKVEENKFEYD